MSNLICEPTGDPEHYDKCPKCGNFSLCHGFGLSGGGYGPYSFCESEGCDYFSKVQVAE